MQEQTAKPNAQAVARDVKKAVEDISSKHKAQIPEWKESYAKITAVAFNTNKNGVQAFILAAPTPSVIDAYKQYDHKGQTKKIDELLVKNCVLAGNTEMLEQDVNLKNAVLKGIVNLLEDYESAEKEL